MSAGMTQFTSFCAIIELWPSREALAADVNAGPNGANRVSKWFQRDFIPADWWVAVLGTQRAIEAGVTAEILTALAAREPAEVRA